MGLMITFKREGSVVICKVEMDMPYWDTRIYHFRWETGSDVCSSLLTQHARTTLSDKLRAIRKEAYNRGWKDAKAKTKKEEWFSGWF